MASVSVGFSIPEQERDRLDHLVDTFGGGNRSAFLRVAMDRMETLELADKFRDLQGYWSEKADEVGVTRADVDRIVHEVLADSRVRA